MNNKLGRFGLLRCNLIDPLSTVISNISEAHNNRYNSVGLYYINENGEYNVILYDLYDSYPIKWTYPFITINKLLSSQYITKLNYHSLDENVNNVAFTNIYQHNTDNLKSSNISKLEKKFINIISGLTISYDYKRNYETLLKNIITDTKHGYRLINKILSILEGNNISTEDCNNFVSSLLIKKSHTCKVNSSNNFINFINDDVNVFSHDIKRIKQHFYKMYANYDFLTNIDHSIFQYGCSITNKEKKNNALAIKALDIKNLGVCLNHIVNSETKIKQCLAVKNMVEIYNNMIVGSKLSLIIPEKDINVVLLPELIFPELSIIDIISIVSSNINTQNNSDLQILSEIQLFDILIYIDSLRDSSGFFNNKFAGVQNTITKELASRKNTTNKQKK
jgi:hypothetical protein